MGQPPMVRSHQAIRPTTNRPSMRRTASAVQLALPRAPLGDNGRCSGSPSSRSRAQLGDSGRSGSPSSPNRSSRRSSTDEAKHGSSLPPVDSRRGLQASPSLPGLDKRVVNAPAPAKSLWAAARGSPETAPGWAVARGTPTSAYQSASLQELIKGARLEWAEKSKEAYHIALNQARRAWKEGSIDECHEQLNEAAELNPNCEIIHRFRAVVRSRAGRLDEALTDAGNAVAIAPGNPRNHHALAVASQAKQQLAEAGTAYLSAMNRGIQGSSSELGYTGYLNTVRRQRHYFADVRPPHRKTVQSSLFLARTPSRASIFDPQKVLEEGEVAAEDLELPDPPVLSLISAEMNSVTVGWEPARGQESLGITIYAYEMEMAIYDVVWEGNRFFDGYRPFERVHKASSTITTTMISGLQVDCKIMLRIRAQSYSGFGDWNELVVSTLPPLSKQADALPLPRKWLQVDVGDLVPLHVLEVGGDPMRFFTELAACFEPHVRAVKRLFNGWSRAGVVGQKVRAGELSRMQFHRFVKEVGLGQGGGVMCKRSGAKLLATNDIDRIFQRANTDNRGSLNSRGSMSSAAANLNLDQAKVAELTEMALDELSSKGGVESDAGESELRDKLRPLFDEFDEDGSGAVSTEEVGKMAAKLGMEMTPHQLQQLMMEADPDGSGEIEFEELVAVLKKQIKEGRNGSMAALFHVTTTEEGDGGAASMVLLEFIHALVRLAWECYGEKSFTDVAAGIGTRLNALLERAVLPGSAHLIESSDPMEAQLRSRRVHAITEYYSDELFEIFKVFAASDTSLNAQAHMATLSFPELVFMMKSGGMLDASLTVQQMTTLFAQVNSQASDDGEKDDDSEELSFAEFKTLVCRIANAKIPENLRGGEPFEFTWQSFLQIIFIPRFKSLIKDMKRGLTRKNL